MFIQTAYAVSEAQIAAQCLVDKINGAVLFPLIGLMSGIALLVFLWGAFEYVKNADNDSARQLGQNHLLYGVIGLLVMVSAYAILSIAAGTFGLNPDENIIDNPDCSSYGNVNSIEVTGSQTGTNTGGQSGSYEGFDLSN